MSNTSFTSNYSDTFNHQQLINTNNTFIFNEQSLSNNTCKYVNAYVILFYVLY